jgi:hypothetical protein
MKLKMGLIKLLFYGALFETIGFMTVIGLAYLFDRC